MKLKIPRPPPAPLVPAASSAAMADTASLSVTANLAPACKITSIPAMVFNIDPNNATGATATSAVQYKCTSGTSGGTFRVGVQTNGTTGHAGTLNRSGGGSMNYTITWPAVAAFTGSGFGAGSDHNQVTLTGAIAANQYQNAVPGAYIGSVTVEIAP